MLPEKPDGTRARVVFQERIEHVADSRRLLVAVARASGGKVHDGIEIARRSELADRPRVVDRDLARDHGRALAAQRIDMDAAVLEQGGGGQNAGHGMHEVLEHDLLGAVGAGDLVGMMTTGEDDVVLVEVGGAIGHGGALGDVGADRIDGRVQLGRVERGVGQIEIHD